MPNGYNPPVPTSKQTYEILPQRPHRRFPPRRRRHSRLVFRPIRHGAEPLPAVHPATRRRHRRAGSVRPLPALARRQTRRPHRCCAPGEPARRMGAVHRRLPNLAAKPARNRTTELRRALDLPPERMAAVRLVAVRRRRLRQLRRARIRVGRAPARVERAVLLRRAAAGVGHAVQNAAAAERLRPSETTIRCSRNRCAEK